MDKEFKPNKAAFYFSNYYLYLAGLGGGYYLANMGGAIVGLVLSFFYVKTMYDKEEYAFFKDKFVRRSGTWFTDNEVELNIENITHVNLSLHWLKHKLFGTGSIQVEAAGSQFTEVYLRDVDNSEDLYGRIRSYMQDAGFSLKEEELVQEEEPAVIGAFFEAVRNFVFVSVFGFLTVGIAVTKFIGDANYTSLWSPQVIEGIVALALVSMFFRYKNLIHRKHWIYNDTIRFEESFLTKNYSFMPVENLADSSLSRNLLERIIGVYEVKLSTPGSSYEIAFKNIRNGPEMEENIDALISSKEGLKGKEQEIEREESAATVSETYRKDWKKVFLSSFISLGLLLFVVDSTIYLFSLIPGMEGFPPIVLWGNLALIAGVSIVNIIRIKAYKYRLRRDGAAERFKFITEKNKEYSFDNITCVKLRESWIDWITDTFTIEFWSVGSASRMKFKDIKKDSALVEEVKKRKGLTNEELVHEIDSDFSVGEMLKALLPLTVLLLVGVPTLFYLGSVSPAFTWIGAGVLGIMILFTIYQKIYYDRSHMRFYQDRLWFKRGIFIVERYHSMYDDIKAITTTRYPFSSHGSIKFNVAGEELQSSGDNQVMVSYSFKISYSPEIKVKDDYIDVLFYSKPSKDEMDKLDDKFQEYASVQYSSDPEAANTVVPTALVELFFLGPAGIAAFFFLDNPLIMLGILVGLLLPPVIAYISVKVKNYRMDTYRVVGRWGIFYKKQKSVIYSKIDHLKKDEGLLNKIFGNGNVDVQTWGSGSAELMVKNIPDYEEFYEKLKEQYEPR